MSQRAQAVVESRAFQGMILGLIVLAAVLVGLETSPAVMERFGPLLLTLDKLVLAAFAAEALLKMAAHGRRWWRYFRDPWNVFDFTIVAVCLLPVGGHYAAVLRLARVARALRLVTAVPRLQLLVASLLRSLPSMVWVGLLLGLLFYVYAVTGVFLFREHDPENFGHLGRAMLTLFKVVTLDDWATFMRRQFEPGGAGAVVSVVYFVSFVLVGTMIILNLFIGVIINSMHEAQSDAERRARRRHVEATGVPTLGDELADLEHELDALRRRVHALRRVE